MGLGFIYWGVFFIYGLITVGYIIWMYYGKKTKWGD